MPLSANDGNAIVRGFKSRSLSYKRGGRRGSLPFGSNSLAARTERKSSFGNWGQVSGSEGPWNIEELMRGKKNGDWSCRSLNTKKPTRVSTTTFSCHLAGLSIPFAFLNIQRSPLRSALLKLNLETILASLEMRFWVLLALRDTTD